MNLIIRQEQVEDYKSTENVVKLVFANAEHSDKKERSEYLNQKIQRISFQNYHWSLQIMMIRRR